MVTIDIAGEFDRWLSTDEARTAIATIFRQVIKEELQVLLMDDLVDSTEAARMLDMSVVALRKAVERGQVPCVRIGRRLRFRRVDLLQR